MNENYWNAIFMAIPSACLVLTPKLPDKFIVTAANKAYIKLTNTTVPEIINKDTRDAFPPNPESNHYGHTELTEDFLKVLETGESVPSLNRRYDLWDKATETFVVRYFTSENIPLKDASGKVTHILHTTREVTVDYKVQQRQKELEAELDLNRQQNSSFINENPDGLVRMNPEGIIIQSNQSLAKVTEMALEDVIGAHFESFCALYHKERIFHHFQKAKQGVITSFEADFFAFHGKRLEFQILLIPMFIEEEVKEIHGIVKDISLLRKTEKVMIEKSKFLEVNATFIDSLLETDFNADSLYETFGIIAQTVQADRMYYCGAEDDPETQNIVVSQKIEWCSEQVSPQIDNPELQRVPLDDITEIVSPLQQNQPFTSNVSSLESGKLKSILEQQQIQTILLLPIFVEEKLFGFVGFDNCIQKRVWKQEEISFLKSLTQNLAHTLEKSAALKKVQKREEELKLSEQKFRALVQEGSDLMAILDFEGNYSFVSDNYHKHMGFKPDELIGKNALSYLHPEDCTRVRLQFDELCNQKQIILSPFRFRNVDGEYRWIQTTATNLIQDKAVNGIVANSRDITTVMKQAQEIENINERYALAAKATKDLIYDWDLVHDKIVRFHRGEKELFGYPASTVNQSNFWKDFVHPDDFHAERKKLMSAIHDPNISFIKTEYRFRKADGTYAQIVDRGYIIRDHKNTALRLIGATSDISEIIAKKEELKTANKRFKIAMKATNEMIWDWDVVTDVVTRSKGYENIFGYQANDASTVHSFWMEKVVLEDREKVRKSLEIALKNSLTKKWKLEYRFVKANGKIAHVIDRGYILRHKNGKAHRLIGAVLDVTNSRKLLSKVQSQNKILKQIAWEQSHVVRAPVARIKGLLDLLEEESFDEISREEILFHIRESANELDVIIRDIVGKTESIKLETR